MNNTIEDFLTITNNGLDVDANNVNANCITSKNNKFSMDTSGNLICNSITTNVSSGVTFDQIYPVGSIYLSVNDVNPGTLFGGTWVKISDKFLIGAGNNYALGATGGEETHTLSINEMPNHSHNAGSGTAFQVYEGNIGFAKGNYYTRGNQGNTGTIGGSQAHNNMPPYLAVNIWKRTN